MRNKQMEVVVPKKAGFIRNEWWKIYPKLNSAKFTNENAGRITRDIQPYGQDTEGELRKINGVSHLFNILGYTLNPPFDPDYDAVSIMFERKSDFTKFWLHYCK